MQDVVIGVVQKEDNILIVKRKKDDGVTFSFPSGKIEGEETPEEAVCREVQEETGVTASIISCIGQRIHPKNNVNVSYFLMKYEYGIIKITDPGIEDVQEIAKGELKNILGNDIYPPVLNRLGID